MVSMRRVGGLLILVVSTFISPSLLNAQDEPNPAPDFFVVQGGNTDEEEMEAVDRQFENAVKVLEWGKLQRGNRRWAQKIDAATLDLMVFGHRIVKSRRLPLEDVLKAQVKKTCEAYHLNDAHQRKLLLAGQVDILRLFDQFEILKRETCFQQLSLDEYRDAQHRAKQLAQIYGEFPHRVRGSFYSKVLNQILNTERITPIPLYFIDDPAALEAAREVEYYKSLVEVIEKSLAAKTPLQDKKQRMQLAEMFRQQLQTSPQISLKDSRFTLQKLSKVPERAWQSILNQAQLDELSRQFVEVQAVVGAENGAGPCPKPAVNP